MHRHLLVIVRFPVCVVLLTVLIGCTNEQVYTAVQDSQRIECQKYPDTRYEECMEQLNTPYDEYEMNREAEKQKPGGG